MKIAWLMACALPLAAGEWTAWAPREEIAPKSVRRGDSLITEGGGNTSVFGGWVRDEAVKPGQWYRLKLRYKAAGIESERTQLRVSIGWQDANGKNVGEKEAGYLAGEHDGWKEFLIECPADARARSARIEALILNAPAARVEWREAGFERIEAPKPRPVRVSAIRFRPQGTKEPAVSVKQLIGIAESKLREQTDVVLFPEAITLIGTGKTYIAVSESIPGPTTATLGEFARKRGTWVVAGIMERDGATVYNTSVLINRQGAVAGKYRKVYLPQAEVDGGLTPGSEYPVFDTDFGKVGMMICYDAQFADPARYLAMRGAELILMPIWGGPELLTRGRALENQVFIATSGYDYPASVVDPEGAVIASSDVDGTAVSTVIDLNRRYSLRATGNLKTRYRREVRLDRPADIR